VTLSCLERHQVVRTKSLIVLQSCARLEITCDHLFLPCLNVHLSKIDSVVGDLFLFMAADRDSGSSEETLKF